MSGITSGFLNSFPSTDSALAKRCLTLFQGGNPNTKTHPICKLNFRFGSSQKCMVVLPQSYLDAHLEVRINRQDGTTAMLSNYGSEGTVRILERVGSEEYRENPAKYEDQWKNVTAKMHTSSANKMILRFGNRFIACEELPRWLSTNASTPVVIRKELLVEYLKEFQHTFTVEEVRRIAREEFEIRKTDFHLSEEKEGKNHDGLVSGETIRIRWDQMLSSFGDAMEKSWEEWINSYVVKAKAEFIQTSKDEQCNMLGSIQNEREIILKDFQSAIEKEMDRVGENRISELEVQLSETLKERDEMERRLKKAEEKLYNLEEETKGGMDAAMKVIEQRLAAMEDRTRKYIEENQGKRPSDDQENENETALERPLEKKRPRDSSQPDTPVAKRPRRLDKRELARDDGILPVPGAVNLEVVLKAEHAKQLHKMVTGTPFGNRAVRVPVQPASSPSRPTPVNLIPRNVFNDSDASGNSGGVRVTPAGTQQQQRMEKSKNGGEQLESVSSGRQIPQTVIKHTPKTSQAGLRPKDRALANNLTREYFGHVYKRDSVEYCIFLIDAFVGEDLTRPKTEAVEEDDALVPAGRIINVHTIALGPQPTQTTDFIDQPLQFLSRFSPSSYDRSFIHEELGKSLKNFEEDGPKITLDTDYGSPTRPRGRVR
mmetsp:Transcript_17876/g.50348  ORF Transcript_17876/g.50348 Transcript_17876/m.50348 type:complete len:657 (+) Transcript_17876:72-2042(+)